MPLGEKYLNIYAGYFCVYMHIIYSVYNGHTNRQLHNTIHLEIRKKCPKIELLIISFYRPIFSPSEGIDAKINQKRNFTPSSSHQYTIQKGDSFRLAYVFTLESNFWRRMCIKDIPEFRISCRMYFVHSHLQSKKLLSICCTFYTQNGKRSWLFFKESLLKQGVLRVFQKRDLLSYILVVSNWYRLSASRNKETVTQAFATAFAIIMIDNQGYTVGAFRISVWKS